MTGPIGWWCLRCNGFFMSFQKHPGHPLQLKRREKYFINLKNKQEKLSEVTP